VHETTFSFAILMEYLMKNYHGASDLCVHSDKFINISGVMVSFVIPFSITTWRTNYIVYWPDCRLSTEDLWYIPQHW
jgi:hypothetical protein